jgi:hypothetical protein
VEALDNGGSRGGGGGGGVAALAGGKHVQFLHKHLLRLRGAYDHGNRTLFYDELVTAYLLAFFNPTMRSLRAIEDAGRLDERGRPTRLRKLCRSTMSDANAVMDARLLEPLIGHLRAKLPDLKRKDGQLARLLEQVRIVDGSFFASAATVVWALKNRKGKGGKNGKGKGGGKRDGSTPPRSKIRLDLHLDGARLLPAGLSVHGKGTSEAASAAAAVEPGVIYVIDRGFENLTYVAALLDHNADFVGRVKTTLNFTPRQKQTLDADDRAAGVISDRIGRLDGSPHCRATTQELREVLVFDPDHPDKPIRLITSLLDVPAHVIAAPYRWRWQIELFFRWLKVHAHFEHLISRSKNGMTLGFYVAVIATLLIYLHTGRPMSKYAYNLLGLVAAGWGTIEDMLPILEQRERQCRLERERVARKRAEKAGL